MTHVQKDHEDNIRVLLQQIPSEEEKAEMQRVRQDLEDKKKELERLEVLRQENESLKQIRVLLQQIPSEEEKAEMQRVRQDLEDKKKELERLEVLRQENESLKQIRVLLQQIPSEEEKAEMQRVRQDLEDKKKEIERLEVLRQENESLKQNAAQRLQEAKEHLTRQHDLAMTHVQKDHEENIRVLLQQIPSEEEKAEMQRVRQDLEDKKKELERLEVLRQENESLKQGCNCKGKCKRNCKCRDSGLGCASHCSCLPGKFANIPKAP
ncbi:uncharacterized protein F23F12.8 [Nematostella vectensis]|uniref:uncharacterized protein F23F12.8 n=1 Tax=Nematostella vectensis TaxID=45351 RepID=UPI00207772AA|nr:uncharacterized protein F23F12.8 [Nematostella vectensis]